MTKKPKPTKKPAEPQPKKLVFPKKMSPGHRAIAIMLGCGS